MKLTPKVVAYVGSEEALVQEAYLDSAVPPVWTWAMGVATTSGSNVLQYKDHPQPLDVCLKASIQLMQNKFLPLIAKTFDSYLLSENQLAAALSFVWRNGTLKAQWVADFKANQLAQARVDWLNWSNHGTELARATRERDLFFDNKWPALKLKIYPVKKPSYHPDFAHPTIVDPLPMLQQILGGQ